MSKWTSTLLALVVLVVVSVHASPILDGATNKVMGRQETAPTAEVVVPAVPAAAAPAASAEDEEDDDDDDDDYGLGLDDDEEDDDTEDDDEEDDDDDDDYLERFFDDILADDDDDDDDDEKPVVKPTAKPTPAPVVTAAPTPAAAKPSESEDDDDYDDEEEDSDVAASETDEQGQAEKDEGDDNELTSYDEDDESEELEDDDDDEEEYEEDETDIVSAKRSRALKTPKMPAAHLAKYNNFVDTIIERINEVVKKSFDPVTVRLTRGSPAPPSRRPVKNDPKQQTNGKVGDEGPSYELVAVSRNEDLALGRSDDQTPTPLTPKRPRARPNKNKNANKQNNRQRARATLMGLSSMRRDGDVTVNSMSEHTTIRSRFLLGPLTLRVEKQFGRGAKKELRSATATTDKMTGRMVLRVNRSGVATLHSVRVLQPKQVRVESDDDHDQTREFVWRRSSHIARLVSQKLTKAARELLQAKAGQPTH